jgi:hypothetical protein
LAQPEVMRVRARRAHSRGSKEPVDVEIIVYAPTVFYHCQHCELTFQQMGLGDRLHRREAREALPADLIEQYRDLSEWVSDLVHTYGDEVSVRVVDAASLEGFWKSLRYRVHRYPTVIVGGREKMTGTDFTAVNPLIESVVAAREEASKEDAPSGAPDKEVVS